MSQTTMESHSNRSSRLLIVMGILWLGLAGALIFYQLANPASVTIQWNTETELDTAGFYLYRSESADGEYTLINEQLIDSEGNAVSGASYTFDDENVEAGKTYYYLLEEIQNDGKANRYEDDKFSYTVPGLSWWAVILAAAAIIVGLGLLVVGFREV